MNGFTEYLLSIEIHTNTLAIALFPSSAPLRSVAFTSKPNTRLSDGMGPSTRMPPLTSSIPNRRDGSFKRLYRVSALIPISTSVARTVVTGYPKLAFCGITATMGLPLPMNLGALSFSSVTFITI